MLIKDKSGYYFKGNSITEERYNEILTIIHDRPQAPEGYTYILTDSIEWELYEVPIEEDPELTELETLEILLGGEII